MSPGNPKVKQNCSRSFRRLAFHHFADNLPGSIFILGQNIQLRALLVLVHAAANPILVQCRH